MYDQFTGTTAITVTTYIITIIIGGLGNTGVIFIYFKDKQSRNNIYHFLISNMAAADLVLSCVFTTLLLIYRANAAAMTAEKTPVCEMILLLSMTGTAMQCFIFPLLAKNRKDVTTRSTQNENIASIKRNVAVMWFIAIASGIVMIVLARKAIDSGDGIPKLFRCLIINQSFDLYTWFFLGFSIPLFTVALVISAFKYLQIYRAFKMHVTGINASVEETSRCKMTALLNIIHTLCWTPFILVQFMGIFGTYSEITFNLHAISSAFGVSASAICIPFYYKMDKYYHEKFHNFIFPNKTE